MQQLNDVGEHGKVDKKARKCILYQLQGSDDKGLNKNLSGIRGKKWPDIVEENTSRLNQDSGVRQEG